MGAIIPPVKFTSNLLKNGNFINNSSNGYGGTPDDWTSSSANPVQGGFPTCTKQEIIDYLGVADGDIELLCNLNGNFNDLSSNGYNLTAAGSPTDNSDGLMAQAKTFNGSTQYANNAAANTNMTGSQTWVICFKPASLKENCMMALRASGGGNYRGILAGSDNRPYFNVSGLSPQAVIHDAKFETGKWYFIVAIYDSSAAKLKFWLNGSKKEVNVTGSPSAVTSNFAIARLGDQTDTTYYLNGTLQNTMVFSVALSDDQVKRLWSLLTYKGIKIRRSGSDGYMYQDLDQELVERLRGKIVTFAADISQVTSSIGQLEINDGTSTTSTVFTSTSGFVETAVTRKISATATSIQLRIKAITTNGNVWYKEARLYEASSATIVPYQPSSEDWARFPRLLRLKPPMAVNPYQYEENRWYSYTPSGVNNCTHTGRFIYSGYICHGRVRLALTGTPGFSSTVMPNLPITSSTNELWGDHSPMGYGGYEDSGTANRINSLAANLGTAGTNLLWIFVNSGALLSNTNPITWANNDRIDVRFSYEID